MKNQKQSWKIALVVIAASLSAPAWAVFPVSMVIQNVQLLGGGAVLQVTNTVTCGDPDRFTSPSGSIFENASAFQKQGSTVVSGGGSNFSDPSSFCDGTPHDVTFAITGSVAKKGTFVQAIWNKKVVAIISNLSGFICFTDNTDPINPIFACEQPSINVSGNFTPQ